MAGLTPLGIVHTVFSLIALASGVLALARYKELSTGNRPGRIYLAATLITAASTFGIFRHGGFGPGHALAVLTLAALAVGMIASRSALFGGMSRYVRAISFSSTMLFHLIPGFTEALTRLPPGAPVFASAQAPEFKAIYGVLVLIFIVALAIQLRWVHAQRAA